ncbi:SDR family oxidoreductase [Bdellovibrio bacteriovorus]|uniref:SDR family oxidoreductase n=1 Tax=Bdellovibrio bacteriovorus TaxID=959 RepID=UPI0035A5B04F
MRFKGKTAVIIGGTSGIGLRVAENIIKGGGKVIVGGRTQEKMDKALSILGKSASGFLIDNTNKESIAAFFKNVDSFDYLFSPGASYGRGMMTEISDEIAESPFKSKFWGQYWAVKHSIGKISSEGAIVLMSGAASVRPVSGGAAYSACNGAIESLGKALATELAPVRVNVVSPGTIDSDLWQQQPAEVREAAFKSFCEANLLEKVGTVDEVASTVLFLLENTYMTGSTLYPDGGYALR